MFDHDFEWGPAKNRPENQPQTPDQRDASGERPDDN